MDTWTKRYLNIAKEYASWSKDPSTKVGAVCIGSHGQQVSQGYNGFPRGVDDNEYRLNNRPEKYTFTAHGEMNCIYNACLNGSSLKDTHLYVYGLPVCSECAKGVIQVGIKKVFMQYKTPLPDTWLDSFKITHMMFTEANVEYVCYDEKFNIIHP